MQTGVARPESQVQRTTQALHELIGRGRYGGTLPGEPRLARELKVSRGTLRKALDTLAFLRELVAVTEADGISVAVRHSAATRRNHPAKRLDTLVREQPADLWLPYEASIPVAGFFRTEEIPAVVCGGAGAAEGLPFCAYDGTAALRHAIGVLMRAGHTRIVTASRCHRPLRERVFREEFERRGLQFDRGKPMPLWSDPGQLHHLFCSRLHETKRLTAWIVNGMEV